MIETVGSLVLPLLGRQVLNKKSFFLFCIVLAYSYLCKLINGEYRKRDDDERETGAFHTKGKPVAYRRDDHGKPCSAEGWQQADLPD